MTPEVCTSISFLIFFSIYIVKPKSLLIQYNLQMALNWLETNETASKAKFQEFIRRHGHRGYKEVDWKLMFQPFLWQSFWQHFLNGIFTDRFRFCSLEKAVVEISPRFTSIDLSKLVTYFPDL